MNGDDNNVEIG